MTDILVPTPGESITEVEIGSWLVENGSWVNTDQEVVSLESEKATLEVTAPVSGIISIMIADGEAVEVGSVIGRIDESASRPEGQEEQVTEEKSKEEAKIDDAPEKAPPPAIENDKPNIQDENSRVKITPVAKKMMEEYDLSRMCLTA